MAIDFPFWVTGPPGWAGLSAEESSSTDAIHRFVHLPLSIPILFSRRCTYSSIDAVKGTKTRLYDVSDIGLSIGLFSFHSRLVITIFSSLMINDSPPMHESLSNLSRIPYCCYHNVCRNHGLFLCVNSSAPFPPFFFSSIHFDLGLCRTSDVFLASPLPSLFFIFPILTEKQQAIFHFHFSFLGYLAHWPSVGFDFSFSPSFYAIPCYLFQSFISTPNFYSHSFLARGLLSLHPLSIHGPSW